MATSADTQKRFPYTTLDVFTTTRFTGNQLGLVHLPSRSSLTEPQKQALAIEFNYSETVFLYPKSTSSSSQPQSESQPESNSNPDLSSNAVPTYSAQIFTPKSEIPFAGHPTIGTAVYIFENLEPSADTIALDIKAGRLAITFDRTLKTAQASIAHDFRLHQKSLSWADLLICQPGLDVDSANVETRVGLKALKDTTFPLVSIVPGMSWALVDLTNHPELLNNVGASPNDPFTTSDLDADSESTSNTKVTDDKRGKWQQGFTGTLFYKIYPSNDGQGGSRPRSSVRVRQRMMAIGLEDPATGSASCALAAYLALMSKTDLRVEIEQGVEMGRASKIFVSVQVDGDRSAVKTVELSGQAVEVMSGTVRC